MHFYNQIKHSGLKLDKYHYDKNQPNISQYGVVLSVSLSEKLRVTLCMSLLEMLCVVLCVSSLETLCGVLCVNLPEMLCVWCRV